MLVCLLSSLPELFKPLVVLIGVTLSSGALAYTTLPINKNSNCKMV